MCGFNGNGSVTLQVNFLSNDYTHFWKSIVSLGGLCAAESTEVFNGPIRARYQESFSTERVPHRTWRVLKSQILSLHAQKYILRKHPQRGAHIKNLIQLTCSPLHKDVNNRLTISILFCLGHGRAPANLDYDPVLHLCNVWSGHRTEVMIVVRPHLRSITHTADLRPRCG